MRLLNWHQWLNLSYISVFFDNVLWVSLKKIQSNHSTWFKKQKTIQENINILTCFQNLHIVLFPIVTKNIKFFEISANQLIIECKRWWLNWFHGHVAKQFEELRCSVRRHLSKTSMKLDVTCNPSVECQWFDKPMFSVK